MTRGGAREAEEVADGFGPLALSEPAWVVVAVGAGLPPAHL